MLSWFLSKALEVNIVMCLVTVWLIEWVFSLMGKSKIMELEYGFVRSSRNPQNSHVSQQKTDWGELSLPCFASVCKICFILSKKSSKERMSSAAASDLVAAVHCEAGLLSIEPIAHGSLLLFLCFYFLHACNILCLWHFQKRKNTFPGVYFSRCNVEEA